LGLRTGTEAGYAKEEDNFELHILIGAEMMPCPQIPKPFTRACCFTISFGC
jgi:hypothetical protein